jgi:plastocyanin
MKPNGTRVAIVCVVALAALASALASPRPAQAAGLTASFDHTPTSPQPGQEVTFTATSTSPSTTPIRHSWDLDGDGQFDDGEGNTAKTSFAFAGSYVVRLKALQASAAGNGESIADRTIEVGAGTGPNPEPQPTPGNQAPVAVYDRQCKGVGTLLMCAGLVAREGKPKLLDASKSRDPDGQIVKYEWDLDANGSFERDSGTTPTVTHNFEALGGLVDLRKRTVRVRVTDDDGGTDVDEVTLTLLEPACEAGMSHGRLKVKSVCLRQRKLDGGNVTRWYAKDAVVLNGITVVPRAGSTFVIDIPQSGGPAIKVNRAVVTAPAKGSSAKLLDGRVDWKLSGASLAGFDVDRQARLNGLRISGMPSPPELFSDGSSELGFHVALPQQFGGTTSSQPIIVRPGGATAAAAPLSFEVANAAIGPIGLEQLKVTYDGVDLWEIAAKVGLPEPIPYTIEGDAGIRGGEFEHAGAAISNLNVPIGPVFLQRIGFRVEITPKKSQCVPKVGVEVFDQNKFLKETFGWNVSPPLPDITIDHGVPTFALCGDVALTAGPEIIGLSAIGLDAKLGLATYDDRPAVLRAFGEVSLVEIPLADASFEVHTNGYMKMLADFHWGIEDVASIQGFVMFEALFPKFNAKAFVEACLDFVDWCAGAKAMISSKGVAVCLKIDVLVDDWEPGFGYRWGDDFPTLYFAGCELGPYTEHIDNPGVSAASAAAASDVRTIQLPGGLPGAAIALKGRDAAPKVTLVGPRGERITTPDGLMPVEQAPFFVLKDPRAKLTQIAISKPSAGRWRIEVEDGSSKLVSLRSAEGLENPKVKARVTGRGHRRAVTYRIEQVRGQKVTFMERGPSAGDVIGVARGERGTLRFTPADGRAERREIVAIVEQNGRLRDELIVANYGAPAAQRPGRPARLRLKRGRSALSASWRGVPLARRYQVTARLSDGRRLVMTTRHRRVTVRPLSRRVTGTVQVRALSAAGMKGRATSARVAAAR